MTSILCELNKMLLHAAFDSRLNMAFNLSMAPLTQRPKMSDDKRLIEQLGGPTKLAALLGYPKHGGVQRIQNWMTRGIPAQVKLDHPDLFLNSAKKKNRAA